MAFEELMPQVIERPMPTFEAPDNMMSSFGNVKINQRINCIMNYEVIEKTKTFTILRIQGLYRSSAKIQA